MIIRSKDWPVTIFLYFQCSIIPRRLLVPMTPPTYSPSLRNCWRNSMNRVYPVLVRLCLVAAIAFQAGCITVNLIEPSGPVKEVQLSGTGADKVLLLDLSGVISAQDREGIIPQPNMLATFKDRKSVV